MVSKINQLLHLIFLALNYYLVKKKKILTLKFFKFEKKDKSCPKTLLNPSQCQVKPCLCRGHAGGGGGG